MAMKPFFIRAEWDEKALVWVASSDDVPGLATEEETLEGLIKKLNPKQCIIYTLIYL